MVHVDIRRTIALVILTFSAGATVVAGETVDFTRQVLPILKDHCLDCHGADEQESNLRLDSFLAALAGGDSGERVVVPGNSGQSYLIELVSSDSEEHRMPPEGEALTPGQIKILRAWIDQEDTWQAARDALAERTSDHWSLAAVVRPSVPSESEHPIDGFIQGRLTASGLKLSPRARRSRLIRRLYLVMLGLPPSQQQVQAFVEDRRPDAWERLVTQVLDSPHYGERMATHWLDLVRFGESHGFETNRERPHAWRYRDWVIRSFNEDKPYDQFVTQQIAGDALGEDVGTGFLVAGPYDLVKGQDPLLGLTQRQDELADMINATGTAFMGLTLGCARCHNHKFDPVTQTDYYALQAVFAGVNHADRKLPDSAAEKRELASIDKRIDSLRASLDALAQSSHNQQKRKAVTAALNFEQVTPLQARLVRMTIDATNQGEPCIDELEIFEGEENVALAASGAKATSGGDFVHALHKLQHINDGEFGNAKSWIAKQRSGGWVQIEFPKLRTITRIVWARDRQKKYGDRLATDYRFEASIDGKEWTVVASSADRAPYSQSNATSPEYDFDDLPESVAEQGRSQLAELNQLLQRQKELQSGRLAYVGTFSQPGPTHRLYRGEVNAKREEVPPNAIAAIGQLDLPRNSREQDRRLALARWIASSEHPLTARVIVNRLWHFHFGAGIVDTPSDFGANGSAPTHPELLDWLAVELIDNGWSLKHIQRLILTSDTWQQDSRPVPHALKVDASSRLLWRFPPRRMEAEAIRDSILFVSGKLDLQRGGPGFSAFEVEMENVRHYHPKKEFGQKDWRRMVYMTKIRQERDAVFGVFDCPDGSQVTPKRSRSTTPLQALNLLNSRFINQQAEFLAERLKSEAESQMDRIRLAYQLCFSRTPRSHELSEATLFVDQAGWVQFARALLNANELVFIP